MRRNNFEEEEEATEWTVRRRRRLPRRRVFSVESGLTFNFRFIIVICFHSEVSCGFPHSELVVL